MVKLFNFPCVVHDAPHRAYRGHSSHVMSVRFNCDSTLVCSGGGHDWAVFQVRQRPLLWGPISFGANGSLEF